MSATSIQIADAAYCLARRAELDRLQSALNRLSDTASQRPLTDDQYTAVQRHMHVLIDRGKARHCGSGWPECGQFEGCVCTGQSRAM